MEKYSSKNKKYRLYFHIFSRDRLNFFRLNGKFVEKYELPVGSDDVDERYLSSCGKFYKAYHKCLKDMVGDPVSCKMFRKRLQKCEVQKGFYDDIKNALKMSIKINKPEKP